MLSWASALSRLRALDLAPVASEPHRPRSLWAFRLGARPARCIYSLTLSLLIGALYGCASTPVKQSGPTPMGAEAPCWVSRPDCRAQPGEDALYFVGQSEQPLASWGRPQRASVHSAQQDAEQQYARFLGVEIKSSIYLQSLLEDAEYQSQFSHTLTSNSNHEPRPQ